ncbi:MAG: amidase [Burkholderiales bacterium]
MADIHAGFAGQQLLPDGSVLTCRKLVELYMDRINAIELWPQAGVLPVLAVLGINPQARQQADALDALYAADGGIGNRPLHCVPMLLKDNYDTFDHPSTSGSYSMLGHQRAVDAHAVDRLRTAGALILGKANMDEFALMGLGFSGRGLITSNPYNTLTLAGGSSSGSGAGVAASFAAIGTGTDTCGSIRFPAAVNGLAALRPSVGLVSQHGVFPLITARDAPGPMARTLRDMTLALNAMAGEDPRDAKTAGYSHPVYTTRPSDYTQFLNRTLHGLNGRKLALVTSFGGVSGAGTGETVALIQNAIAEMRALGAEVFEISFPDFVQANPAATQFEWNQYFRDFEMESGYAAPRRCMSSIRLAPSLSCVGEDGIIETGLVNPFYEVILAFTALTTDPNVGPDASALAQQAASRAYVEGLMDSFVTPDNQIVRLDALLISPDDNLQSTGTCAFGSTTQMPSLVVPIGKSSDGVPKGIEFMARKWDEPAILGLAYDYEQATGHRFAPTLAANPLAGNLVVEEFNRARHDLLLAALNEDPFSVPVTEYLAVLSAYLAAAPTAAEVQVFLQTTVDDVSNLLQDTVQQVKDLLGLP